MLCVGSTGIHVAGLILMKVVNRNEQMHVFAVIRSFARGSYQVLAELVN